MESGQPAPEGMTEMVRMCDDEPGLYNAETVLVSDQPPPAGASPEPAVQIDPLVLARTARSELPFPEPVPRANPGLDTGTYAQMPTAFWVDGWQPVSRAATAGAVSATVTATPVRQHWQIDDPVHGQPATVSCDGPGTAYAPGEPVPAQPACGWTPRHSSAGQTARGGSAGEPCFPGTVTVTWDVAWTSTVGAGGSLGAGTSSADVCLVVAEVQAVVTGAG